MADFGGELLTIDLDPAVNRQYLIERALTHYGEGVQLIEPFALGEYPISFTPGDFEVEGQEVNLPGPAVIIHSVGSLDLNRASRLAGAMVASIGYLITEHGFTPEFFLSDQTFAAHSGAGYLNVLGNVLRDGAVESVSRALDEAKPQRSFDLSIGIIASRVTPYGNAASMTAERLFKKHVRFYRNYGELAKYPPH